MSGLLIGSVKSSSRFKAVMDGGAKALSKTHIIFFLRSNDSQSGIRLGMVVSKKNGKAVKRNYIKRRLKSCFAELAQQKNGLFIPGEYVILARPSAHDEEYSNISAAMQKALSYLRRVSGES